MTQLIINVENKAILPSLRKVLKSIEGISVERATTKKRKCGLDIALDDIRAGRVHKAKNIDELLYQELGI
jgi:hypothetical protein